MFLRTPLSKSDQTAATRNPGRHFAWRLFVGAMDVIRGHAAYAPTDHAGSVACSFHGVTILPRAELVTFRPEGGSCSFAAVHGRC